MGVRNARAVDSRMIEIDPPVSMFDGTCMTLSMESSLLLLLLLLSVSEKLAKSVVCTVVLTMAVDGEGR
jgi:hypothetical protein